MAVLTYTSNIKSIAEKTQSLERSVLQSKSSLSKIQSSFMKRQKVRGEIFQKRQELNRRRLEDETRREAEDVIEYSKTSSISQTPKMALARTGKSFLGRIMDFISNIAIGWLVFNLPTWIGMATEFVKRVTKLGNILYDIVSSMGGVIGSISQGLVNVVGSIKELNFAEIPNQVSSAFNQMQMNLDRMTSQFEEGFELFNTGLDKSITGTNIPEVGAEQTTESYTPTLTPSFGSGGTRSQQAFTYFKSQGYTSEQAAAIVGNLTQENRALDPRVANSIGYKGIAQWDPKIRYPGLVKFAKQRGLSPDSFEAQLAYVEEELRTGSGGLSKRRLQSTKSLEEATLLVRKGYLRPGESEANDANRLLFARQALAAGTGSTTLTSRQVSGTGGQIYQYLHGDPNRPGYDPKGHWHHDHYSFTSRAAAVKAFLALKKAGFQPYEFEGYTSVGGHSDSGGHYGPAGGKPTKGDPSDGTAFDIPYATYGSGPIGPKDYAKSREAYRIVTSAIGGSGGLSPADINPTPSSSGAMTAQGITPQYTGEKLDIVIPEMGLSLSGDSMPSSSPEESTPPLQQTETMALNNFVKNHFLVELAYL